MEQRFGYSLEELARRFDRSVSWVSRRLALVELLPGPEGAPRVSVEDCQRMVAAFVQHRSDTRQAGQLYAAWRDGSRVVRQRILAEPELFLKTQRQPAACRSPAGDGRPATGTSAGPDRRGALWLIFNSSSAEVSHV